MTATPKTGDRLADGSIYLGLSPDTGAHICLAEKDAPLSLGFYKAAEYANRETAHGHKDWRLPTMGELEMMFNSRAAIGNFDQSDNDKYNRYYSSQRHDTVPSLGHARRFTDGATAWVEGDSSVRCVRHCAI